MNDKAIPAVARDILTEEQIEKISGGSCTAEDFVVISGQLREAYDNLVDFTSYVMERVLQ